ncbi:MAG: hypothetical protein WEE36_03415 [Acidimicrobiia bacterium]
MVLRYRLPATGCPLPAGPAEFRRSAIQFRYERGESVKKLIVLLILVAVGVLIARHLSNSEPT